MYLQLLLNHGPVNVLVHTMTSVHKCGMSFVNTKYTACAIHSSFRDFQSSKKYKCEITCENGKSYICTKFNFYF